MRHQRLFADKRHSVRFSIVGLHLDIRISAFVIPSRRDCMGSIGKLVKSVLGGGATGKTGSASGLSAEKVDLLRLDLAQLKPDDPDFPGRALRFVLEGEESAVLRELARSTDAAAQLRLLCSGEFAPPNDFRRRFFSSIEPVGPALYLRLAKLYESAARSAPKATYGLPAAYAPVRWMEIMVEEATGSLRSIWPPRTQDSGLTCALLEELLAADGQDPQLLLAAMLEEPAPYFGLAVFGRLSAHLADIGDYLTRNAGRLLPLLQNSPTKARIKVLELISRSDARLEAFVEGIICCGVDSAKTLRESAEAMIAKVADAARPLLEQTAREGSR